MFSTFSAFSGWIVIIFGSTVCTRFSFIFLGLISVFVKTWKLSLIFKLKHNFKLKLNKTLGVKRFFLRIIWETLILGEHSRLSSSSILLQIMTALSDLTGILTGVARRNRIAKVPSLVKSYSISFLHVAFWRKIFSFLQQGTKKCLKRRNRLQ